MFLGKSSQYRKCMLNLFVTHIRNYSLRWWRWTYPKSITSSAQINSLHWPPVQWIANVIRQPQEWLARLFSFPIFHSSYNWTAFDRRIWNFFAQTAKLFYLHARQHEVNMRQFCLLKRICRCHHTPGPATIVAADSCWSTHQRYHPTMLFIRFCKTAKFQHCFD